MADVSIPTTSATTPKVDLVKALREIPTPLLAGLILAGALVGVSLGLRLAEKMNPIAEAHHEPCIECRERAIQEARATERAKHAHPVYADRSDQPAYDALIEDMAQQFEDPSPRGLS